MNVQVLANVSPPPVYEALQAMDLEDNGINITDTMGITDLQGLNDTLALLASETFIDLFNGSLETSALAQPLTVDDYKLCNWYLPNDSTLNRFLWVLNYFASRGFYVVLQNHINEDPIAAESPVQWLQDWKWLMGYACSLMLCSLMLHAFCVWVCAPACNLMGWDVQSVGICMILIV